MAGSKKSKKSSRRKKKRIVEDEILHSKIDEEAMPNYVEDFIVFEKENLKEAYEYKRADEQEWASRQGVLQIQAEEAQRLRRLRRNSRANQNVEDSIIFQREKLKETDEYKRAVEQEWASRQRELQIQAEEAQRLRCLRRSSRATLNVEDSIIFNREKFKETDEYKRAVEQEWASRQRELQIQAEEAQRLRRLRRNSREDSIIFKREKQKETDEYKRAVEQEWASRQRELQIQAEEAKRLRSLLRRKKAESMRAQDMERRQQQRVDDIRETQKKDIENMKLKDVIRAQISVELQQLEERCHDMISLLRGLGTFISNAINPSSNEVRSAYKRALLTFHPDRVSSTDIYKQAKEKFKLISRMKAKIFPTSE